MAVDLVYRIPCADAKHFSRAPALASDLPMTFTSATILFLARLGFGCLVSLAFLRREQTGASFSRFMAGMVAVAATIMLLMTLAGDDEAHHPASVEQRVLIIAVCATTVAYIFAAGAGHPWLEAALLWVALAVSGAALFGISRTTMSATDSPALAQLASFASALVLGLVGGALVLGHWYLVVPGLALDHLARLNHAALFALYARTLLLAITLLVFADRVTQREVSSFRAMYDLLGLITRVVVGLVAPIVLGHLTAATIRLKATQPATGILYASTVLVLMGELIALVVTDSLRIPA